MQPIDRPENPTHRIPIRHPRTGLPAVDPGVDAETEHVVLVDENDVEIGTAGKLAAHLDGGQLHRAFSVVLFDDRGRMLIQQRAAGKYHFPLLWTNACCSHPRPGEEVESAAHRRTAEELGVEAIIERAFCLLYEATDPVSGLTEREYDHVFVGRYRGDLQPRAEEVAAVALWSPADLYRDMRDRPQRYTPWFREMSGELVDRGLLKSSAPVASPTGGA